MSVQTEFKNERSCETTRIVVAHVWKKIDIKISLTNCILMFFYHIDKYNNTFCGIPFGSSLFFRVHQFRDFQYTKS